MLLQITMLIIIPVSSGSSGPWTDNETKVCIAIYLAIAVLWILQVLYSLIFNKLTLKEALTPENNDYFLVEVSNVTFYFLTVIALIAVIGVGVYNCL